MATPRTIALPWETDERGTFRLTSAANQGVEATSQMIALSLLPPGRTDNPWLFGKGFQEDLVFARPHTARVDIESRLRSIFAGHKARERAELVAGSTNISTIPGRAGAMLVEFRWRNLRTGEVFSEDVEVGG